MPVSTTHWQDFPAQLKGTCSPACSTQLPLELRSATKPSGIKQVQKKGKKGSVSGAQHPPLQQPQATQNKDNPLSLCTLKGKPEQEWQPWGHTGPVAPSAAQLEPTGLSPQLGLFWLLPVPFQTHSARENLSGTNQSNTSELLQFTSISSPTPGSCKEKKIISGLSQTWSSRDSTSIKLQKPGQCCTHSSAVGILPWLRGFSRGNHTLQLARMKLSHQPLLAMLHPQKGSGEEDVLCHCLFLCPALTRSWFCPDTFLFCTKEGLFPPLQDPSALQSTAWETRTAGKQRGVAQRKGQSGRAAVGCVYIWGTKALFKVHASIQRYRERGSPASPAGERSSLGHPEPCPAPQTPIK